MADPKKYWKSLFDSGRLKFIDIPTDEGAEELELVKYLGSGGFGSVFSAHSSRLNKYVAVKLVLIKNDHDRRYFLEEVRSYDAVSRSPGCNFFIVCLYNAFEVEINGQTSGVLVTELMAGDVLHLAVGNLEMPVYIRSTLEGLAYIHGKNLAHRDLKPDNILRSIPDEVSKGNSAVFKLGDLGLVCSGVKDDLPSCSLQGTPVYNSPYYVAHFGQKATIEEQQAEDVWQWGITLYVVIYGDFPTANWSEEYLERLTQSDINNLLANKKYPSGATPVISGDAIIEMIRMSLRTDWRERPTVYDLLNYFNQNTKEVNEVINSQAVVDLVISSASINPSARSSGSRSGTRTLSSLQNELIEDEYGTAAYPLPTIVPAPLPARTPSIKSDVTNESPIPISTATRTGPKAPRQTRSLSDRISSLRPSSRAVASSPGRTERIANLESVSRSVPVPVPSRTAPRSATSPKVPVSSRTAPRSATSPKVPVSSRTAPRTATSLRAPSRTAPRSSTSSSRSTESLSASKSSRKSSKSYESEEEEEAAEEQLYRTLEHIKSRGNYDPDYLRDVIAMINRQLEEAQVLGSGVAPQEALNKIVNYLRYMLIQA